MQYGTLSAGARREGGSHDSTFSRSSAGIWFSSMLPPAPPSLISALPSLFRYEAATTVLRVGRGRHRCFCRASTWLATWLATCRVCGRSTMAELAPGLTSRSSSGSPVADTADLGRRQAGASPPARLAQRAAAACRASCSPPASTAPAWPARRAIASQECQLHQPPLACMQRRAATASMRRRRCHGR